MATLPDQVLGWLYNNLKTNYRNVDRTYSELAQTLPQYPTLSPRTEVYTFENGTSALLLVLRGTLAVAFRGTTYRYPIALWLPHNYPHEAPMVFVVPTQEMVVRPGQHVAEDGRVYHPYIAIWKDDWQAFSLFGLLGIVVDVFSKEPPVMARQRPINGPPAARQTATPPPLPDAPHRQHQQQTQMLPVRTSSLSRGGPPPPPPPKSPGEQNAQRTGTPDYATRGPPALPTKPGQNSQQNHTYTQNRPYPGHGTPQPPNLHQAGPPYQQDVRRVSAPSFPPTTSQRFGAQYGQNGPPTPAPPGPNNYQHPQAAPGYTAQQPFHPQQQHMPHPQHPQYAQPHQYQPPQPQTQQKQPIPDLLSTNLDGPSHPQPNSTTTTSHPTPGPPPPPPPPNPQRDALLHTLSQTLHSHLSATLSQNTSALSSLTAQHTALLTAQNALTTELTSLQSLSALLTTNETALHAAINAADEQIEILKTRPPPNIDEILVAPSVVGEQLYRLVAEEKGIGEAMFVLGRALDRGRVGGEVFVKLMRQLARERFLKKVLVGKAARGLGLSGV